MSLLFNSVLWDVIALIAAFLCYTLLYFRRAHNYWKDLGVPTLPPSFPFGNAKRVMLRRQHAGHMLKYVYDRFKPKGHKFCGLYFFSRRAFVPLDPDLIKRVLTTDFQHFHDRGIYHDEFNDPLSASLFTLEGSKWRNLRAKLTPTFTSGKLKHMFPTLLNCGKQLVDTVEDMLTEVDCDYMLPIEMKDLMGRYSTDVIGSCAFGIECNSFKDPSNEFRTTGRRIFLQTPVDSLKMVITRGFPGISKLLKIKLVPKIVTDFFMGVIKDTIKYRLKHNVSRNDFLQLLIQLGGFSISDFESDTVDAMAEDDNLIEKQNIELEGNMKNFATKEINKIETLTINEAAAAGFAFFTAGFETSSSAMSFALFELALNPEIQTRARKEIVHVLKKYDGNLGYDSLMDMHYLDQVVYETLRKYPAAQLILRKCTKRYQIPDTNIFIEKGMSTVIPVLGLHGDPEYFPEPDKFDPDRFDKEHKSKRHDYVHLPFGEGPRICIGIRFGMMQTKVGIAMLLSKYEFSVNEKTTVPLQMNTSGIMITPVQGLWLNIRKIP